MTAVVELALLIWLLFALAHGFAWFCLALAIGVPLIRVARSKMAARHMAKRQELARLVRHADEEHRWVQEGAMDGIYGSYSPPPSVRGMGIWLADDRRT